MYAICLTDVAIDADADADTDNAVDAVDAVVAVVPVAGAETNAATQHLVQMKSFSSSFAIYLGLSHGSVGRLTHTFAALPQNARKV